MVRLRLSYPETPKRFEALVEPLALSTILVTLIDKWRPFFDNLNVRYMSNSIQFLDMYGIPALTGRTEPCTSHR